MKRLLLFGFLLIILGITINFRTDIKKFVYEKINFNDKLVTIDKKNEYYRDYDFDFVQNTNYFSPSSRQDILNIYYTAINAGLEKFSFYCPDKYKDCLTEVKDIANNQELLSHINNFVHPYNSFKNIETEYDSLGKVTIKIKKAYTKEDIEEIDKKINDIYNSLILSDSNQIENIKSVHDYIINNSKYDSLRSDNNIINYKSDIAYGTLIQGYGICGGYTDAMELFLEKMKIKSYKVSSDSHVWNAVFINGNWYHLDLTWDDPVTSDSSDILDDTFFLINTSTLKSSQIEQHEFDQEIYSELKEA